MYIYETVDHETIDIRVFVVVDVGMSLYNIMSLTHTVIPSVRLLPMKSHTDQTSITYTRP